MSLGQIRMCSRPRVGMFFFPLTTGGVGPVATSQPRRPVIRNLMSRCAPSTIPDEWNGLTSAQRDPFEESFSQVIDADKVEHRPFGHPHAGCLSPTLALAGPYIGFRVALLASPNQSKNACPSSVRPVIFRSPWPPLPRTLGMSGKLRQCILVPQVLRQSSRTTTLLVRHGRTIFPRHLKSLKAVMP